jgi:hypothetical protein
MPWARDVSDRLRAIERALRNREVGDLNLNKGLNASIRLLTRQFASVKKVTDTLLAIATVEQDETTTAVTNFSGFYGGSLPTVTISSPTGRIEVGYGGSLNGGVGYFCYSVVGASSGIIVTRASVQSNPARRVAISGGSSFAPSGWKTTIISVPVDEPLTVRLELFAGDTFTYFFGGSIQARVAP